MDKFCCTNCFADENIKEFIKDKDLLGACNYCNSKDVPICDIIDIRSFIKQGIERYYEDAVERVYYEEGEFDLPTLNIEEILLYEQAIFGELLNDPTELLEDLSFDNSICYVSQDPYGPPPGRPDEIEYWKNYCEVAKKQQRFTIFQSFSKYDKYSLNNPAKFISNIAESYIPSLIRIIKTGDVVYRARIQKEGKKFRHIDLTSPKSELTNNNRMSPSGISFFYGGMGRTGIKTCIHEVRPEIGEIIIVAKFKVLKDLFILDLTEEIEFQESIFNQNYLYYSEEIYKPFLKHFVGEISKPIRKSDNEIDYIPTQIFAEFLKLRNFKDGYYNPDESGKESDVFISGIKFNSSRVENGINIVLFKGPDISRTNRGAKKDQWLLYKGNKRYRITEDKLIFELCEI